MEGSDRVDISRGSSTVVIEFFPVVLVSPGVAKYFGVSPRWVRQGCQGGDATMSPLKEGHYVTRQPPEEAHPVARTGFYKSEKFKGTTWVNRTTVFHGHGPRDQKRNWQQRRRRRIYQYPFLNRGPQRNGQFST